MGIGDRFGQQGQAQLSAFKRLKDETGVEVCPVWNKSNREHTLIGTHPDSVRAEADAAVRALGWTGAYCVDADHINLSNVDAFIGASDFFTLDVADAMGTPAGGGAIEVFIAKHPALIGRHTIDGLPSPLILTRDALEEHLDASLCAVRQAGVLYRHIREKKGHGDFVVEVSMDETLEPQTPERLFVMLAAIADEGIPAQTVAPKFTGRFNKGVDYAGDLQRFGQEFNADVCVVRDAVTRFGLPPSLKLSVHSGSDKFSLYPIIANILSSNDTNQTNEKTISNYSLHSRHLMIEKPMPGVHLKTAGTTWLEEVIGLAESGGEGLALAGDIYAGALEQFGALCAPYATVIDIDRGNLPRLDTVRAWDGGTFARTLRHNPCDPLFNPDFRQLIHVAFKVAAQMGPRYTDALRANEATVAHHVTANLYERHLKPVFDFIVHSVER